MVRPASHWLSVRQVIALHMTLRLLQPDEKPASRADDTPRKRFGCEV